MGVGGADLQCRCFLAEMYSKTKELGPVGGTPAAPPSLDPPLRHASYIGHLLPYACTNLPMDRYALILNYLICQAEERGVALVQASYLEKDEINLPPPR